MMKKISHIWIILPLALLIGSLVSSGVILTQRGFYVRGWENAADPGTALPFRIPRPGVNVELAQYVPDELDIQLDDMARAGVIWVRQTFPWAEIEPERGEFDWARWDAIVEAVGDHNNLEIVAVLNVTPAWARHRLAPDHPTAPPEDNADFGSFARLFAERYGDRIDYYQIWDEPNLADAWGGLDPEAADYVALLQAAYTAIHEVDGTATVIAAGLAPTLETGPRNFSDVLFLRAIYENGGGTYFDAAAGKPYGFDEGPEDRRVDERLLNFSRLVLLREEMVRHGDGDKALWASHFGWNALPEDWAGEDSIWKTVSREQQLTFIRAAYGRVEEEWPWLGGMILQHWQPDAPSDDPLWGFSLILPGETRVTFPAPFPTDIEVAGPGRHHPVTPFAAYSGEWEFGEAGADLGMSGNSESDFTFAGTDLALELRRDNYRAYLYLAIDGQPVNILPRDSYGETYLVLTSDDLQPHTDVVPIARGLAPGTHTLHLRGEFGWDQWALRAFRVGIAPDTSGYDAALATALITALGSTAAVVVLGQRTRRAAFSKRVTSVRLRLGQVGHFVLGVIASLLVLAGMFLTWQETLPVILRRESTGLALGLLTAGLLYFSPSIILTIAAAILLWLLIYQRVEVGLFLTLLWAPFFLFPVQLYLFASTMAEVCILLTAIAWALRGLIGWAKAYRANSQANRPVSLLRQSFNRLTALDWGVILLFGLAILSISWSAHRAEAQREWRTMILEPALFYLIARTTIRKPEQVARLVDGLILAGAASAIVGIGMYLGGRGIITAEQDVPRLAGVYGSPNNVGLFMGRVLPFALAYVLLPTGRIRRVFAAAAGLIVLAAAALSQSVGAILLGIPAGIAVVLLLWNLRRAVVSFAGMAVIGLIALLPLSHNPRFARLLDFSSGSTFFRISLWQSAIQMIRERFLQGYGLDQFLYQYRGRFILPEAWQEPNLSHPHNILLDFWTRLGLGGVLLLIWLQVHFWRKSWQAYRRTTGSPLLRAVIVGAMGSMANLLAHGLVDNSVFVIDLSYVFVLLLALPGLIDIAQRTTDGAVENEPAEVDQTEPLQVDGLRLAAD